MAPRLAKLRRQELKYQARKLSLKGWAMHPIANELGINYDTVRAMLIECEREMAVERKLSGEAEADLNNYIAGMREYRTDASNVHARSLNRLNSEEELEAQHAEARAQDGKLPTVMVTRALQFHMTGVGQILEAIKTGIKTLEAEGRVLGLEVAGKEEAQKMMREKQATLLAMLSNPLTIEVRVVEETPEGWDSPADED